MTSLIGLWSLGFLQQEVTIFGQEGGAGEERHDPEGYTLPSYFTPHGTNS